MKITRDGALPMPPPRWPVGSGFECFHCHCQFEIEEGDAFEQVTERRLDGDSIMFLPCPCCGVRMKATRPKTSGALRFAPSSSAACGKI